MPYTIHIDPTSRCARIRVTGSVNGAGIVALCRELFNRPDWEPGFSTLWDTLDLRSLFLVPEDLKAYTADAAGFAELRGCGRSAVVSKDVDVKLNTLVFAAKSQGSINRSVRLFEDVAAAEEWLAKSVGVEAE